MGGCASRPKDLDINEPAPVQAPAVEKPETEPVAQERNGGEETKTEEPVVDPSEAAGEKTDSLESKPAEDVAEAVEAKTEEKVEAKAEEKVEAKAEEKVEVKPEVVTESEAKAEAEPEAEVVAATEPEKIPEPVKEEAKPVEAPKTEEKTDAPVVTV